MPRPAPLPGVLRRGAHSGDRHVAEPLRLDQWDAGQSTPRKGREPQQAGGWLPPQIRCFIQSDVGAALLRYLGKSVLAVGHDARRSVVYSCAR